MLTSLELSNVQAHAAKWTSYASLLLGALMPGSKGTIEYFPSRGDNSQRVQDALTLGRLTMLLGVRTTYVPVFSEGQALLHEARVLQRSGVTDLPSTIVMHDLQASAQQVPDAIANDPSVLRYWLRQQPQRAVDIVSASQLSSEPGLGRYADVARLDDMSAQISPPIEQPRISM